MSIRLGAPISKTGDALLAELLDAQQPDASPLRHVRAFGPRAAPTGGSAVTPGPDEAVGGWPGWVPQRLRRRLAEQGVDRLWAHQSEAAELAWSGRSVVLATGTASGKSLAYQLPVLSATLADDRARTLYLAPTKALAADQSRALAALALPGVRPATLDGDTPSDEREWVRQHANIVLSNPDMLHYSLLGQHQRWGSFLRRLRFVVVDEAHHYRGVFGSHVSLVLRRLRRLAARHGAAPVFVLASATSRDPAATASRLTGLPVTAIEHDASPRGRRTFALWQPPLTSAAGEGGAPLRRAASTEAARLLADLVSAGARTLVFVRSRRAAELTALSAQRLLADRGAADLAGRVVAYRGGYLAEQRRALERALADGGLLGVATTNALELGIDVSGLDAVVLAGYPGTLASLWQQAGRAGRRGQDALVVFVARDDPLDTYLVDNPDAIFGRPLEATVTDPSNPHVLGPQLCCAASEAPLTRDDLELFGGAAAEQALAGLVAAGRLRARPAGWYWTDRQRPVVDLRGAGGMQVTVVDGESGSLLGTADAGAAWAQVHPGAVYLHQGASYLVDELDVEHGCALVHAASPDWTTTARSVSDIVIESTAQSRFVDGVGVHLGSVEVSSQVVSYQRRRFSGEIIDETPLDLPVSRLSTTAVWYTLTERTCLDAGIEPAGVPGALHAAEHAAIGLLPLFASCDRSDIGGVSTARHPDTGQPSVFVYDGQRGGAGFAAQGHAVLPEWLRATHDAIVACECPDGCPSCVHSPKCGNGNSPLDKRGAITVLRLVLDAIGGRGP